MGRSRVSTSQSDNVELQTLVGSIEEDMLKEIDAIIARLEDGLLYNKETPTKADWDLLEELKTARTKLTNANENIDINAFVGKLQEIIELDKAKRSDPASNYKSEESSFLVSLFKNILKIIAAALLAVAILAVCFAVPPAGLFLATAAAVSSFGAIAAPIVTSKIAIDAAIVTGVVALQVGVPAAVTLGGPQKSEKKQNVSVEDSFTNAQTELQAVRDKTADWKATNTAQRKEALAADTPARPAPEFDEGEDLDGTDEHTASM